MTLPRPTGPKNLFRSVTQLADALDRGGGGMVSKLADQTLAANATTFDVSFDGTGFMHAKLYILATLASGAATGLQMRPNNDSGASAYWYQSFLWSAGTIAADASNVDGQSLIRIGVVNTGGPPAAIVVVDMPFAFTSVARKGIHAMGQQAATDGRETRGYWSNSSALSSIRLLNGGANNFTTNLTQVVVYGLR